LTPEGCQLEKFIGGQCNPVKTAAADGAAMADALLQKLQQYGLL